MKYIIFSIAILALFACTSSPSAPSESMVQTAIAQTQLSQPTSIFTSEPEALPTLRPTSTPRPTSTSHPTNTPVPPSPTPTIPGPDQLFARNFVAAQESGGIYIEIARVLFGQKEVLEGMGHKFSDLSEYDNVNVVGEIIFKVANTSDKVLTVHPDQSNIILGSEQIDLWEWSLVGEFGDYYGEIFPGVTLIGGTWFGIKRSTVQEISKIVIAFDGPYDKDYNDVGSDFYFEIDLQEHTWEELPDELK